MTIRKIVEDIRKHAATFLGDVRLRPMVKMATEHSLNDVIVFQSRGGREHAVAVLVSREAQDGWSRAMIAPLGCREQEIGETGWIFRNVEGVSPGDIVILNELLTVEEKVAAIVEHIAARGDDYLPCDDIGACVCTDARIVEVVERLGRVAERTGGEHDIVISGQDLASGEQLVDTVTLEMEDGRTIDVTLEPETILLALNSPAGDLEFRISSMSVLDQAMEQVEEKLAMESRDLAY